MPNSSGDLQFHALSGGKQQSHTGPMAYGAFDLDTAAVFVQHPIDHGEPKTRPALLGRKERIENFTQMLLGDACTTIGEHNLNRVGLETRCEARRASRGHRQSSSL